MSNELPELHDFFGAYFHQDWMVEHETAEQVINAFLVDSEPADLVLVRDELNCLLDQGKDEVELRAYLLKELSCYYCYWNAWGTGELWLRHIVSKLDRKFDKK